MSGAFERTKLLIGEENLNKIKNAKVLLFGIGGVGGFTAEALIRSGVGSLTIVDGDKVDSSNLNRQIFATANAVGKSKVEVAKERLLAINPNAEIITKELFYLPENAHLVPFNDYDYVIDAIDTVTAKLHIIKSAKEKGVKIISCMGTGGKVDAEKLTVTTIDKTSGCALARVMRRELKKLGILDLKVVYSTEKATKDENLQVERKCPPSMIFVPATAGLMLAKEVIFDIINKRN